MNRKLMTTPAPLVTEGKGKRKSWRIVEWAGRLQAGPEVDRKVWEQQKATNGRTERTKEEQEKGMDGIGMRTVR